MCPIAQSIVSEAMTSLENIEIPPILQETIEKHKVNLTSLACALLEGGQDTNVIRQTIDEVLDSFKRELVSTIDSLKETRNVV